jgi:hypothetical protein
MKKELNYLASKRWEKVGRQEFCSTPYKQEINPWLVCVFDAYNQVNRLFTPNDDAP